MNGNMDESKTLRHATKIKTFIFLPATLLVSVFISFFTFAFSASAYGTYPTSVTNPANFHPGYYMLVGYNAGKADFDMIKNNPDFVGVKKVYIWKNIETAENVYD